MLGADVGKIGVLLHLAIATDQWFLGPAEEKIEGTFRDNLLTEGIFSVPWNSNIKERSSIGL